MAAKKGDKPHPDGQIRRSQIVTTFGPGALVDLVERSGIVAGLEYWTGDPDSGGSGFREVHEPRLLARLADKGVTKLYTPPTVARNDESMAGIDIWEFPQWFLIGPSSREERSSDKPNADRPPRSRQMIHRSAFQGMSYGKGKVTPIRFVQACKYGHVSDIDWGMFAHRAPSHCRGMLFLEERGTTGDFADIFIRCACGAKRPLAEAIPRDKNDPTDMPLGRCLGNEPWLGEKFWNGGARACPPPGEPGPVANRLLVRSATNAYFPTLATVISIPEQEASGVDKVIGTLWGKGIDEVESAEGLRSFRKYNKDQAQALAGISDAEVLAAIERKRKAPPIDGSKGFKAVELQKFLGHDLGVDLPESDFFATEVALPKSRPPLLDAVKRILQVHRLREVVAQTGFTRLEPSVRDVDPTLDLGVRQGRLTEDRDWRPAVENRGEGFFVAFDSGAIAQWLSNKMVETRCRQLENGVEAWRKRHPGVQFRFPGADYVMLHSLSHLLITAVSLECGYAASSIRERVYAGPEGHGILLYTSSPDAEGTLGGLAAAGKRLFHHVGAALSYGTLCSNDPVCSQHEPDNAVEERFFHGAACHGCLLLAEPSCEWRNEFLDRALVIPTVDALGAEFFRDTHKKAP